MTSGQYTVRPEAMRSAVGNVGGIIVSAMNVVLDLEALIVPPTSFAMIGGTVATQNTAMQGHQVGSLQMLLKLLQDVNSLVKQCVDDYDAADQQVAASFGGQPGAAQTGSSLWSSAVAPQLGTYAMNDSAGASGEPHALGNILDYMGQVGVGSHPITDVAFHDANGFANWLDASPDNQARAGVVGIYSGVVRSLGDVPGGVHSGDIVVADSGNQTIAVVGTDGQLFNHGPVDAGLISGANVRVYRPNPAPTVLS
jgi:uncharacterized protein YukE